MDELAEQKRGSRGRLASIGEDISAGLRQFRPSSRRAVENHAAAVTLVEAVVKLGPALPAVVQSAQASTDPLVLGVLWLAQAVWPNLVANRIYEYFRPDDHRVAAVARKLDDLKRTGRLPPWVPRLLRQYSVLEHAADAWKGDRKLLRRLARAIKNMPQAVAVETDRKLAPRFGRLQLGQGEIKALLQQQGVTMSQIDGEIRQFGAQQTAMRDVLNNYFLPSPSGDDEVRLDDARARLVALPLDVLPNIADLPPGSMMPHSTNPLFVGRERELKELAKALKGGQAIAVGQRVTAASTGLGGYGKTQLAVEFAHRYGQYFAGGVFWVSFASEAELPVQIARCFDSPALDLKREVQDLPVDRQAELVRLAWQAAIPRLLIFDNCETTDLLTKWRPTTGGSRVLITSRRAVWEPELGIITLPLDVLPRLQSVELIRKHRPDLPADDSVLDGIANELGDHPLALSLAGHYLHRYRHSTIPAAYLASLRAAPIDHLELDGVYSPTGHVQSVARTFALSYERLGDSPSHLMAKALIARAALFAPGVSIPRTLLKATVQPEQTVATPTDEGQQADRLAEDGIRRLRELGLLEVEGDGGLKLHRLLCAFVQMVAEDPQALPAVEEALLAAASELSARGYPREMLPLAAHLSAATERAKHRGDEAAARLCSALGYYRTDVGEYEAARALYERALAIHSDTLGSEHPATASSLNNLAYLLREIGDYKAARPLYERALAIREKSLSAEHPDIATSLNNLAGLLYVMGDYEAARALFERALAICEKSLGPNHPNTATSLNNLALLLYATGDYEAALPLYERALEICEKTLGPDHPTTAASLNNLGLLLYAMGDYEAARPLSKRALDICEKSLGPDHRHTARSLHNLASLLNSVGEYEAARPLHKRAIAICVRALGPDHPETSITWIGLALAALGQEDVVTARQCLYHVLDVYNRTLGPDHKETRQIQALLDSIP